MSELVSTTALWWAVVVSGVYHGINPGMGWPLAVSAGLMQAKHRALVRALLALTAGHLLAMLAILLPFSMMAALIRWESEIRLGAGLLVIAVGIFLIIYRRHPRFLARVRPTQLALWSFLAALAHGAGLMLVPIYLDLCAVAELDTGHQAVRALMGSTLQTAVLVALVHTLSMALAGGIMAIGVYFWLGLKFLSKTWFNLDLVWAISLVAVGAFGVWSAVYE